MPQAAAQAALEEKTAADAAKVAAANAGEVAAALAAQHAQKVVAVCGGGVWWLGLD